MGDSGPRSRRSPLRDPSEYSIDTRSISFFFFKKKTKEEEEADRVRQKKEGVGWGGGGGLSEAEQEECELRLAATRLGKWLLTLIGPIDASFERLGETMHLFAHSHQLDG